MNTNRIEIVWYDQNLFNDSNKELLQVLLTKYENLQTIVEEAEFYSLIEHRANRRVVLIISGRLSETVIPRVHNRLDIVSIYIYCGFIKKYEYLRNEYSKVKAVIDQPNILLDVIKGEPALQPAT